jgi:ribonuclease BN (tRNA processing enzyme)
MVEMGHELILIDSGTGIKNLLKPVHRAVLDRYDRIHLVFSHYHLDHTIGISYWPKVLQGKRLQIHAPQPPMTDSSFQQAIDHLLAQPMFSLPFSEFPLQVQVTPVVDATFAIGDIAVKALRQQHPGGSVTYRFGDSFVFATDTSVNPRTFSFSQEAALLIHEAWFDEQETALVKATQPSALQGHSAVTDLVEEFAKATIGRLAVTHYNPGYTENRLSDMHNFIRKSGVAFLEMSQEQPFEIP